MLKALLLTGYIWCIAARAYLRVSPALSAEDYPRIAEQEILGSEHYKAGLYEQLLTAVLVLSPVI